MGLFKSVGKAFNQSANFLSGGSIGKGAFGNGYLVPGGDNNDAKKGIVNLDNVRMPTSVRGLQKYQEAQITKATDQINNAFAGFNDAFYNKRKQAYENYMVPQLGEQYRNQQHQLGYSLSDSGLGHSSVARRLGDSLSGEFNKQRATIANNALADVGQLKQDVARSQNSLIGEANIANNPSSVAQSALGTASAFQSPSMFQPIGELFNSWGNMYLANQNQKRYAPVTAQANQYSAGYGSSLPSVSYGK